MRRATWRTGCQNDRLRVLICHSEPSKPSPKTCRREAEDEDNMEDWDQEQLEKVIADKHAKEKSNATSIICKHFLDAVERKQYGW